MSPSLLDNMLRLFSDSKKEINTFPTFHGLQDREIIGRLLFFPISTKVMGVWMWTELSLANVRNQTKPGHEAHVLLFLFSVQCSMYWVQLREHGSKKLFHSPKERTCIIKMQVYICLLQLASSDFQYFPCLKYCSYSMKIAKCYSTLSYIYEISIYLGFYWFL